MNRFGVLTMAFGADKYLRQADNMALSLRRHMPGIPLAIVTDREIQNTLFDINIPMKQISQAGTVHKVDLYDYSPFQETLFIDSDCIVTRPFHAELSAIREFDFTPVVSRYLVRGESDLWLVDVAAALDRVNGDSFPKFNGGIYFFKKGDLARRVFSRANELRSEAAALGIKDFDKAGPGDETLIGLSLAELRVLRLYDDHANLMRTPLNMNGRLRIDALGGGCSFNKEGKIVTPAICHFCADWVHSPEYKIAEYSLRNGRPPLLLWTTVVKGRHYLDRLQKKVTEKVSRTLFRKARTPRLA
jgi:hypothetical protein